MQQRQEAPKRSLKQDIKKTVGESGSYPSNDRGVCVSFVENYSSEYLQKEAGKSIHQQLNSIPERSKTKRSNYTQEE